MLMSRAYCVDWQTQMQHWLLQQIDSTFATLSCVMSQALQQYVRQLRTMLD